MKTKPKSIPTRRKFEGAWDQVDYCYHKILYWFYALHNRPRAKTFCDTLERLLKKLDSSHGSIKGEECWSLLYEVRGELDKAILHRRNEIRLIKKLRRLQPKSKDYRPDVLADRLDLLSTLYKEANDIQQAIEALRESKRICSRNRIRFDSPDLLKEYEAERGKRTSSSLSSHQRRST